MEFERDLQYNIGDAILIHSVNIFDIIRHEVCTSCEFDVLNVCNGKPVVKNRDFSYEAHAGCGLVMYDGKLKRYYKLTSL